MKPPFAPVLAGLLVLTGACSEGRDPAETTDEASAPGSSATPEPTVVSSASPTPRREAGEWSMTSSGEGDGLSFSNSEGAYSVNLFCPSGDPRLLLTVAGFTPTSGITTMTARSGAQALVLTVRPDDNEGRPGVTGAAPLPGSVRVAGPLTVTYGTQTAGPFAIPDEDMQRRFESGCTD